MKLLKNEVPASKTLTLQITTPPRYQHHGASEATLPTLRSPLHYHCRSPKMPKDMTMSFHFHRTSTSLAIF